MKINVPKFREEMKKQRIGVNDLAYRMNKSRPTGKANTLYFWFRSGEAREDLFQEAIDCLNEYEDEVFFTRKKHKPFTVEDFRL